MPIESLISPIPLSHFRGQENFPFGFPEAKERRDNDLDLFNDQTLVEFFGIIAIEFITLALHRRNNNVLATEQKTVFAQTSTSQSL